MPDILECPGCGVKLASRSLGLNAKFNAIEECWQLFDELSGQYANDPALRNQLLVDAYTAQHSGPATKKTTILYSLVGLYLALEHGYSGKEVQRTLKDLAQQSFTWPWINPPQQHAEHSVLDVLVADSEEERDQMLKQWAWSVWKCWRKDHVWVKDLARKALSI